jgi:hypothetical protein
MNNKLFPISIIVVISICISGCWSRTNQRNVDLGQKIAKDILNYNGHNLKGLKSDLEKKYELRENSNPRIFYLEQDENMHEDIGVIIYSLPLGPHEVWSLSSKTWENEE